MVSLPAGEVTVCADTVDRNLLADSSIILRDGRALAFREWGEPNGRPVLFFHGMPDSRHFCPDKYSKVTQRRLTSVSG